MSRFVPGLRADPRVVSRDRQSEIPGLIKEKRSQATSVSETAKLLLAGGVAGALSKSATAPLARLTILYQVGSLLLLTHRFTSQKVTRLSLTDCHLAPQLSFALANSASSESEPTC